jgi:hypothetical protein
MIKSMPRNKSRLDFSLEKPADFERSSAFDERSSACDETTEH